MMECKMKKEKTLTNAQRFITAYNEIDHSLRSIYGFKRSLTFSDVIRKAVQFNSVIRKYEETLIDYARLRNSIVHSNNSNYIIAEPHDDVVEEMEMIAKLISTPPRALDKVCRKNVVCINCDSSVKQAIELLASAEFSNVPVYRGSNLLGVANASRLMRTIGKKLLENIDINDYINKTCICDALEEDNKNYYKVADKSLTIEQALNMFFIERKLVAIIITANGTSEEKPLGIITDADVLDMNEILENY